MQTTISFQTTLCSKVLVCVSAKADLKLRFKILLYD